MAKDDETTWRKNPPVLPAPSVLFPQLTEPVSAGCVQESWWLNSKRKIKLDCIERDSMGKEGNSIVRVICEEFVKLLVEALVKGRLEEKDIDAFISDKYLERQRIMQPKDGIYNYENLKEKRRSSAKKRRNVCRKSKKAWVKLQNEFTQFASKFYANVVTASGTEEEETDELINACIKLGMKMIQESELDERLKQVGLNIYLKLTEKSVAVQLDARIDNAGNAIPEILEAAQISYGQRMACMLELMDTIDKETLEDIHHISKYQVTSAAYKCFQELEKSVRIPEQIETNFRTKIHEHFQKEYAQIALDHQAKTAECIFEIKAEIDRLLIIYMTEFVNNPLVDKLNFWLFEIPVLRNLIFQLSRLLNDMKGMRKFLSSKRCFAMLKRAIRPMLKTKSDDVGRTSMLVSQRSRQVNGYYSLALRVYQRYMDTFLIQNRPVVEHYIRNLHRSFRFSDKCRSSFVLMTKHQKFSLKKRLEKQILPRYLIRNVSFMQLAIHD